MRLTPRRFTLLLAVLGALVAVVPASAATRDVPLGTGYDLSNFQCGATLPATPGFVVIEVEGAPFNRTTSSACLQSQYAYGAASPVSPQFYVYAGDTSTRGGSHTITSVCGSAPNATCVHDYAAAAAEDAVQSVDAAALPATPTTWWVDVECATSTCPDWQSGANGLALNQAALMGYVAGLRTRPDRVSSVGFYSTNYQWKTITGQTAGSPAFGVEGLPVWYAAATANVSDGAAQYCPAVGFTGGPITVVQGAPVVTSSDGTQTDPDLLCPQSAVAPTITTATQNALAGSVITAQGTGPASTTLTLSLSDAFTPLTPLAQVTTDTSGHWSETFHLGSDGMLSVADPDGVTASMPIVVIAKINVSKTRSMGLDKLGHCIDRVDGSTYPYVSGTKVFLRGSQDKVLGFGKVTKLGSIGSWNATTIVPCGKTGVTTKATVSGMLPGKATRYAGDGRTAAVKLPVNRTVSTRR